MEIFFNIKSLFPRFMLNYIADQNNKSISRNEKNVFDLLEDVVIILEKAGTINYLSPSSQKAFGPEYKDLIGKHIKDISNDLQNIVTNKSEDGENKIIHLEDFAGNTKVFEVKTSNNKKINRHVVLLKELKEDDLEISFSLKDIKFYEKHFPGIIIKLEVNDQVIKVHHVSENIKQITGYTSSKIKKKPELFIKAIHPKDLHSFKNLLKNTDPDQLPVKTELSFLKDNNEIIHSEYSAIPYKGGDKVVWFGSIIQKENSGQSESLEVFKSAFDHVSEGIIITTAENDNPIVYVNDQFLQETGYSKEEVIGKNPRMFQGLKTNPATVESVRHSLSKKERFRGEIINYRKDGSTFHNLMTINPVLNKDKEVTHFIGVQSNIDYRFKIEEELKESIDRFNVVTRATNDVIWDWDLLENKIIWPSDTDHVYGFIKSEISEDPNWQLDRIHPEDQQRIHKSLYKALKSRRKYWHEEYRFLNANGNYLYLSDKAFIIYDKKDNPVRMIGAKQNITALRKLLENQTKLTKELSYRNKDLSQFTYIVSHNFRSPIARLKGLVNLLNDPEHQISEEVKFIIKHMNAMAENLDETIKDLSEILETRNRLENLEEVDLILKFEKIKMVLQDQISLSEAEILTNFKEAPKVYTLKGYLFSILINLLSNALKYRSPSRKLKIEVSSYHENSFVVIEVKDNGLGINLKMQKDKIFGLYKRFHPHIEGKGLGLFLVKTQAEILGGKVEVESTVNEGTTFRVFLKDHP